MNIQAFEEAYNQLNPEQRKAVDTLHGVVMVIAGPGSGKTQLLGVRIANILKQTDADPENILCLTFTDSAAINMRERIGRFVGNEIAGRVRIHTYHSFGTDIISDHPEAFNFISDFRPVDELDQRIILQNIIDNLPYNSALRSFHPELGYTFLLPLRTRIGELKRAGLTPDEASQLIEESITFCQSTSAFVFEKIQKITPDTASIVCDELIHYLQSTSNTHLEGYESFRSFCIRTLRETKESIASLEGRARTKPLTSWKKANIGKHGFSFLEQSQTWREVIIAYKEYASTMQQKGWIDFDDMLLLVSHALRNNEDLRLTYQEKFQYILVDEFQDNNIVQNQIVHVLGNHPVHEGNPNILVVGDDDQAIYKFGGAHSGVLHDFIQNYPQALTISLTTNYRSTDPIIQFANTIAQTIEDRFIETKVIQPSYLQKDKAGILTNTGFANPQEQYNSVANHIAQLLQAGTKPQEIAILARNHSSLQSLLPYLHALHISYSYQSAESVFKNPEICFITQLLRFSVTLFNSKEKIANELLPDILLHPSWNIPRKAIWELSLQSPNWLETLIQSEKAELHTLGLFFQHLGSIVRSVTFQEWVSTALGTIEVRLENGIIFSSPLKEYLCNAQSIINGSSDAAKYSKFLRQLLSIIDKLEEYRGESFLNAESAIRIIDNAAVLGIEFATASPENPEAVQLLTAHKSKGLEFEYVFLLDADQDSWFPNRKPATKLKWPPLLPFSPYADTRNDIVRILYVAITRAKHTFFATYSKRDSKGRTLSPLSQLSHLPQGIEAVANTSSILESLILPRASAPYEQAEREILSLRAQNIVLSASTFLNYIDIINAGPNTFIERTLLRFPQAIPTQVRYGNVIHILLEHALKEFKINNKPVALDSLLALIPTIIQQQGIRIEEQEKSIQKATTTLIQCYSTIIPEWSADDMAEVNFSSHGVKINSTPITGKIDRLRIKGDVVEVFDYKTGKSLSSKTGSEKKLQELRYKYQFYFYKSLIEGSRAISKTPLNVNKGEFLFVDSGTIERYAIQPDSLEEDIFRKLVNYVYRCIQTLNFPNEQEMDIYKSHDGKIDAEGALRFIEDLTQKAIKNSTNI